MNTSIYTLYAAHTKFGYTHEFTESFTSLEKLEAYLKNHPEVTKREVAEFELDPV